VSLRWTANSYDKVPLRCRLFGHIWRSGWWGSLPYLEPGSLPGYRDGVGRYHINLRLECDRCGSRFVVARIHNWEPTP
jgi:hypothetical protein